jgi:hypothetical protein
VELRVVVGVRVDEPGRDRQAVGVVGLPGSFVDGAQSDDPTVLDADVGPKASRAGAIDDGRTCDHVVEHYAPA